MHVRSTRSIRSNEGKRAFADDEYRAAQPLSLACGTAAFNMGRRAFADEESARHSRLHFRSHAAQPLGLPLACGTAACDFTCARHSRLRFRAFVNYKLILPEL